MYEISANDLKVKGVSALHEPMAEYGQTVITVRGKPEYVVLTVEEYNKYREASLDQAIEESRSQIAQGKYHSDIKKHLQQVKP